MGTTATPSCNAARPRQRLVNALSSFVKNGSDLRVRKRQKDALADAIRKTQYTLVTSRHSRSGPLPRNWARLGNVGYRAVFKNTPKLFSTTAWTDSCEEPCVRWRISKTRPHRATPPTASEVGFPGSSNYRTQTRRACICQKYNVFCSRLIFRFVRKNRGLIRALAACQVSDREPVRECGMCGSRRIFSW